MTEIYEWAMKWQVPMPAVQDLLQRLGAVSTDPGSTAEGTSESAAQAEVRLEASEKGARLFRNNVGATYDERGNFIRYGLANDSKALNDKVKSGDLIGIRPILITPQHVGKTIGQFVSREIKAPGWRYTNTPREQAQFQWATIITGLGGDACFATGRGTF